MAEEKEKPLTREDVIRLIVENGGTAEGLDLSGKVFEVGIDLRKLDLSEIILKEAILTDAHLEGAILYEAKFSADTKLELVDWGNYVLGEEKEGDKRRERDLFRRAEDTYRRLKQWYTNTGVYGIAGEFFFREMTAQRKSIEWWLHPAQRKRLNWWLHPRHRLWSKFVSLICGYGERPLRVIGWAVSVVLGLAVIYFLIGSVWECWAFCKSLYFSAVSFTALGYGSWLQMTNNWIRGIGAFESFIGVFTIALFLITFTRKMRR